ncbi:MAG: MBL fold metallo-hydrolase, partial [Methyloceanibacter sp.]|nr:MBL fold metallo-hydrolase [Methyloceanibacter sp.]
MYPSLINGRFGDPALFVGAQFEGENPVRPGDITALPPRNIRRIEHVFVSHAHIDHFIGFDLLLRVLVGREATVKLY